MYLLFGLFRFWEGSYFAVVNTKQSLQTSTCSIKRKRFVVFWTRLRYELRAHYAHLCFDWNAYRRTHCLMLCVRLCRTLEVTLFWVIFLFNLLWQQSYHTTHWLNVTSFQKRLLGPSFESVSIYSLTGCKVFTSTYSRQWSGFWATSHPSQPVVYYFLR